MGQAISSLRRYGCNRINVMISAHGAPKDFFCPFGRNEGTLFAGGGELSASQMKQLMEENPDIAFNFVIESCFSERFYDGLKGAPNLGNVVTSASPHHLSHSDENGSPFILRLIAAWKIIYHQRGNKGKAPKNFGSSIPVAFKLKVLTDPSVRQQQPKLFRRIPVLVGVLVGGGGNDPCRVSPYPCAMTIGVDGFVPGTPARLWGVGIVTVTPAPTDNLAPFGRQGSGFTPGSWAAQFNSQYGCANGYTAVNICDGFAWNRSETLTLTAYPVPVGGYSANASPGSEAPSWPSVFVGWGGDCASAGTSTTCTLHLGKQRSTAEVAGQSPYELHVTATFAAASTGVA